MTGLFLAMWIGINQYPVHPTESYDYPQFPLCAVDTRCGPGQQFTAYSYDLADLGPVLEVGENLYGITAMPNGRLSWAGGTLSYATNGWGSWNNVWTAGNRDHFMFLRNAAGELFVAIEDLPPAVSDYDYNDALYRVRSVPEPGTFVLFITGIACALGARRAGDVRRRPR
jgi:hypothetical protein